MMSYEDVEGLVVAYFEYMWEYWPQSIVAHRNCTGLYPPENRLDGEDEQATQENFALHLFNPMEINSYIKNVKVLLC